MGVRIPRCLGQELELAYACWLQVSIRSAAHVSLEDFILSLCHPRECGDPEYRVNTLDSRLRGNDRVVFCHEGIRLFRRIWTVAIFCATFLPKLERQKTLNQCGGYRVRLGLFVFSLARSFFGNLAAVGQPNPHNSWLPSLGSMRGLAR